MYYFGRADGLGYEAPGIRLPGNHVNLLSLQFVDNALDAVAPQADAGAYRVNPFLGGVDGNLAAKSGVPRDALDFHRTVIDLRHLNLEETLQHIPVAARDQDLRPLGPVSDVKDEYLNALSLLVPFGGYLFVQGHYGLGTAHIQDYGAIGLQLFYDAGNNVLPVLQEFFVQKFPFRLPEPLQNDLLGGLGRDAAGVVGQGFGRRDFVPQFYIPLDDRGILQGYFPGGVLYVLNHCFEGKDADVAGIRVKGDGDILTGGGVILFEGRRQGHLNGLEHLLLGQMALGGQLCQRN